MKITIDVDITPEELRSFIGLPNVEKLQEQMLAKAQEYVGEASKSQYTALIGSAMQPMMAYQSWLQKMMSPNDASTDNSKENKDNT